MNVRLKCFKGRICWQNQLELLNILYKDMEWANEWVIYPQYNPSKLETLGTFSANIMELLDDTRAPLYKVHPVSPENMPQVYTHIWKWSGFWVCVRKKAWTYHWLIYRTPCQS